MTRYLTAPQTAKHVRAALKASFPGVKFSVRSDVYAGGASIRVHWVDGPTSRAVEAVTAVFAGGRFDGQTDLAYNAQHWLCQTHGSRTAAIYGNSYNSETAGVGVGNGPVASRCCGDVELVQYGANYVFVTRTLSDGYRAKLVEIAQQYLGSDFDGTGCQFDLPCFDTPEGFVHGGTAYAVINDLSMLYPAGV